VIRYEGRAARDARDALDHGSPDRQAWVARSPSSPTAGSRVRPRFCIGHVGRKRRWAADRLAADGDITKSTRGGTLNVKLTDAELSERKTKWKLARPIIHRVRCGNMPAG